MDFDMYVVFFQKIVDYPNAIFSNLLSKGIKKVLGQGIVERYTKLLRFTLNCQPMDYEKL